MTLVPADKQEQIEEDLDIFLVDFEPPAVSEWDPELINNVFALVLTALMAFFYAIANVASRDTNKLNIVTTNLFMASIGFISLIILFLVMLK